ncbi:PAS domain-containing protein [Aliarcobacter skirrowii]|jgi:aerotaxis receptor|uniref:PAS sensor domain-containing protein n=2 Tax=Aliarcobacter skirrowii TaxID=28200 RepID=A0AAD0WN05_9BACT|nr:PAS domain-containing protein [Aliarcobacter skirrowii]AXX84403.1 PAS sensor-containing signal transduction protein [Aliarcobacter skirrowii CCUG 10374]AZL53536.1 PAS domain S-box protein [Aliarcobacter skirrowii]KAB0621422.1 PAS domain-containing protein [Aliarcobacter skirrowii CCUG 10374]MCT7445989.1 PAS domain-containing protein [Aliarcobacter skirrowii]MDX3960280.1 PAS domain-containing protein [Aliarcobacter skirrowii]
MSKEIILDDYAFLVSETNEKGNIIFANDDFCEIAGFTVDELIGKPHNIVRHKDMPKAAFKDLWETVKRGEVWTGYVKNATKSGDFYWVFATVFPTTTSEGTKGYISCRKKATIEEIKQCELLYKQMRDKER